MLLIDHDPDRERLRNLDDHEKRALIRILSFVAFFEDIASWFHRDVEVKLNPSYHYDDPHFDIEIIEHNRYTSMHAIEWNDKENIEKLLRFEIDGQIKGSVIIERRFGIGTESLEIPKWARLRIAEALCQLTKES